MYNESDIQAVSQYIQILSDYNRLSILFLLKERKRSVSEIVENLNLEQSAVSHQLKILRDSRLVKAKRQGKSMIYELDDDHVFTILQQIMIHVQESEDENKEDDE
ncbi:ArsR/SmtB family transcription factor [Aerococcaceae bacterium WGS1372]